MNNIELLKIAQGIFPILMAMMGWYMWSLKQRFISKKDMEIIKKEIDNKLSKAEFREFQKEQHKEAKNMGERLIKIETYMESMSHAIIEIKEYLFKRGGKN